MTGDDGRTKHVLEEPVESPLPCGSCPPTPPHTQDTSNKEDGPLKLIHSSAGEVLTNDDLDTEG